MLKLVGAELGFEDRELAPEAAVLITLSVALLCDELVRTRLRICCHQLILHGDAEASISSVTLLLKSL